MKTTHQGILLFVFLCLLQSIRGGKLRLESSNPRRASLIYQEEFDTLDYSKWQHLITGWRGGNNEFQYYTDRKENSYVRDGILYIKPTFTADRFGEEFLYNGKLDLNKEGCNINIDNGCVVVAGDDIINPIQSARMRTSESFSFTYGSVEVRAKMPKGDWIWPAIWMLPTDEVYGGWPRSGEIDIAEVRGNLNLTCNGYYHGRQLTGSTLHWGTESATNCWPKTHWEKINTTTDFSSDFHLYRVDWLPTGFEFFIDSQSIGKMSPPAGGFWQLGEYTGDNIWKNGTKMAPFDQKFHFILNVAVGGNFFPEGCTNVPFNKPWGMYEPVQMRKFWESQSQWLPTWNAKTEDNAMKVDYIRVYSA